MKTYNILIVDDHPIIASAYKVALLSIEKKKEDYKFDIDTAIDIDSAEKYFSKNPKQKAYDLVFLDIKLPKSTDGKLLSGEDLGIEIRKQSPNTKIIIATTYNDNYRINNILKSVDPDGFLVKNDITPDELVGSIKSIIDGIPYYSETVVKLLRKHISNNFYLDKIDRQLLYELSTGTKMMDLPSIIPMSIGGIERRKRQLKEIFNISKGDDKALVDIAKERGFI